MLNARELWYPIVLQLQRLMSPGSRFTTIDPLVCGSYSTCNACVSQQCMQLTRQSTELASPCSVSRRRQRNTGNWILSRILPYAWINSGCSSSVSLRSFFKVLSYFLREDGDGRHWLDSGFTLTHQSGAKISPEHLDIISTCLLYLVFMRQSGCSWPEVYRNIWIFWKMTSRIRFRVQRSAWSDSGYSSCVSLLRLEGFSSFFSA